MSRHTRRLLSLLYLLCLALAIPAAVVAQVEKEVYVAKVDPDGVQRVRMVGGEYFFKPYRIVVRVNVPVEFLASREAGMVPHNLIIQAPQAGIAVEADLATEPKKVGFTATAVGQYPIYCGKKLLFFASHREKGMEGILEVIP